MLDNCVLDDARDWLAHRPPTHPPKPTPFPQTTQVAAKPGVLDVLQLENLPRQLERQEALLGKVQRALGAYLRRQRAAFPRFYFIGDEDLLEVIGNGSEPRRVCQHLGKMFAGLAQVRAFLTVSMPVWCIGCADFWMHRPDSIPPPFLFDFTKHTTQQVRLERRPAADTTSTTASTSAAAWAITAMLSKEGEEVPLHSPVLFLGTTPVREWLAALEAHMRSTLALLLAAALGDARDGQDLSGWAAAYPAQIVILALQVKWTAGVEAALLQGSSNSKGVVGAALAEGPLAALEARLKASARGVLGQEADGGGTRSSGGNWSRSSRCRSTSATSRGRSSMRPPPPLSWGRRPLSGCGSCASTGRPHHPPRPRPRAGQRQGQATTRCSSAA